MACSVASGQSRDTTLAVVCLVGGKVDMGHVRAVAVQLHSQMVSMLRVRNRQLSVLSPTCFLPLSVIVCVCEHFPGAPARNRTRDLSTTSPAH